MNTEAVDYEISWHGSLWRTFQQPAVAVREERHCVDEIREYFATHATHWYLTKEITRALDMSSSDATSSLYKLVVRGEVLRQRRTFYPHSRRPEQRWCYHAAVSISEST